MEYIKPEEVKQILFLGDNEKIVVDIRLEENIKRIVDFAKLHEA